MIASICIVGLLALASPIVAAPFEALNSETFVNDLGYKAHKFLPGKEPGSEDYLARFGSSAGNATMLSLEKRQNDRYTVPTVGSQNIKWGCIVSPSHVLHRIWEVSGDFGVDGGSNVIRTGVQYVEDGFRKDGNVVIKPSGSWPKGMQEMMIEAVKAEAPPKSEDFRWEVTRGAPNLHLVPSAACNMSYHTNWFSVVVRNEGSDAMVANLEVEVEFQKGDDPMCGIFGDVSESIVGAINGVGGAAFGFIRGLICD